MSFLPPPPLPQASSTRAGSRIRTPAAVASGCQTSRAAEALASRSSGAMLKAAAENDKRHGRLRLRPCLEATISLKTQEQYDFYLEKFVAWARHRDLEVPWDEWVKLETMIAEYIEELAMLRPAERRRREISGGGGVRGRRFEKGGLARGEPRFEGVPEALPRPALARLCPRTSPRRLQPCWW